MNIFVGFGYNDNDKWIKELVFPLLESFDVKISTGEDLHGQIISEEVKARIAKADGIITFLTRREKLESGKYTTHRWVDNELTTALSFDIPAVEIRDILVDSQNGISGDRQRIEFDLDNKAKLLVEVAKLLSSWRRNIKPRRLFLLPRDIVQDVRPHINKDTLSCTYRFITGSKESQEYKAKPFKYGQGLCVDVFNVPSEDSLVQVNIDGPNFEWSSAYESVQLLSINLQKN